MTANSYSTRWFEYFHVDIPAERTNREVEFICNQAPLPPFRKAADICCGMGRHSRALAALGYEVTGIERDAVVVDTARRLGGGPKYVRTDILEYSFEESSFDLVLVMSQSFGHFSEDTNRDLLARFASAVRQGGIVVLDLWNPEFFLAHEGTRAFNLQNGKVIETKRVVAERLFVHLDYPDGSADDFEWQLFTASQMESLASTVDLALSVVCTEHDASVAPKPDSPRLQFVLQKRPSKSAGDR
jgi:SAM-dependent methyltransferase